MSEKCIEVDINQFKKGCVTLFVDDFGFVMSIYILIILLYVFKNFIVSVAENTDKVTWYILRHIS